ncbi:MAG TPA: hypothetical protein DCX27_17075 [Balneola sp.]|nr:hypothetical protein [Balneola sp.]
MIWREFKLPFGYSAHLPLQYNPEDGHYVLLKNITSVAQQNLKMLVLTNPGERIMIPEFGVGISRYLFQQEGRFTSSAIKNRILSQVNQYLPYIEINNIEIFERKEMSNTFQVIIEYNIPSVRSRGSLALNLTSQDGQATGF